MLTWTGDLAAGATATVTFSVTANNPDTGDKLVIINGPRPRRVSLSARHHRRPLPQHRGRCSLRPWTSSPPPAAASTSRRHCHYTVTITNTGQTPYTGITVTDDLAGLLDDAAYNGDATATAGTVSFTSPDLTWTGSLAVGAAATVTFTATVTTPPPVTRSDHSVTSAAAGSNCPAGSTDPPAPPACRWRC